MRSWIWVPVSLISLSAVGCVAGEPGGETVQTEASPAPAGPADPKGPVCAPGCATRIDLLERQVSALRAAFTSLQVRVSGAEARLGDLESELASLTGVPRFVSTSTGSQVRSPSNFATIPGMEVTFTTTETGPALVWFYANAAQLAPFEDTGLLFRLMIDDEEIIDGNRVREDFIDDRRLAALMQFHWTVEDLPPGEHVARVEWVGLTGFPALPESATMDSRTLTVAHGR